jgi:hypothetical protein
VLVLVLLVKAYGRRRKLHEHSKNCLYYYYSTREQDKVDGVMEEREAEECGVVGVWCGGVVVWWCGGVVWWCGGVVVWWRVACGVWCVVCVMCDV